MKEFCLLIWVYQTQFRLNLRFIKKEGLVFLKKIVEFKFVNKKNRHRDFFMGPLFDLTRIKTRVYKKKRAKLTSWGHHMWSPHWPIAKTIETMIDDSSQVSKPSQDYKATTGGVLTRSAPTNVPYCRGPFQLETRKMKITLPNKPHHPSSILVLLLLNINFQQVHRSVTKMCT